MEDHNIDPREAPASPVIDPGASSGPPGEDHELVERLSSKVVGQREATRFIVPYLQMHQAGLAPPGRPVGVFLLLGPTGTGKTRTVEALAEILHGSEKNILKIDCGEFQSDHEVAKLIGAPPGYVGHRETRPLLSTQRLAEVTTPQCSLALVLFDEIEKAAPALSTLLLGILDKARLRLGDGTEVDFEQSLIFLTSNLGAREMMRELSPRVGFSAGVAPSDDVADRLESIGLAAVRRRFSPEFVNRLDVVITYRPLDEAALSAIVDQQVVELTRHVTTRLGPRSFEINVTPDARRFLLERGTSTEYGARELRRTFHRHLVQPLAARVASGGIAPRSRVRVALSADGTALSIESTTATAPGAPEETHVLVVDDNVELLAWFEATLTRAGFVVFTSSSVAGATEVAAREHLDAALLDYVLPDGDGVALGVELVRERPGLSVIMMSGTHLPDEETATCERYDFPLLTKPFLAEDVVRLIEGRMLHNQAVADRTTSRD